MSHDSSVLANIEATLTAARIIELEFIPVVGKFDAKHLCEIHRRIFQDLPANGLTAVNPGQYRPEVPIGKHWLKQRKLETLHGNFFVAYSRMDTKAYQRLDAVLANAKSALLRAAPGGEVAMAIAALYVEIDFIHPFSDGNSRTLRTFTRQLAREAGYVLDWGCFNATVAMRDGLYIARDNAVNQLAKPEITDEFTMRKIIASMAALQSYPKLHELVVDAVKPVQS
jgi:cell filamentation protein